MPLIGAPAGTYVTLRIYKRLTANPSLVWANTYEFHSTANIAQTDVDDLVGAWSGFEQAMHLVGVHFDRAVVSTWVEDGTPYDPTSFITVPLSLDGTRPQPSDALSLNNVLFIRRQTDFGQNGKLFLRRCLVESEVNAAAGTLSLLNASALQIEVQGALASSGAGAYLGAGNGTFQAVMKSNLLLNREIQSLVVAGARVMQFNNRYFDVP